MTQRSVFARFENLLEGIVEGAFGKIFRTRLQPVEIARRLERAMDENIVLSPGRQVAPNVYVLTVSEKDLERFQEYMRTLIARMQTSLIEVAKKRGYILTTKPFIVISSDPRLVTGEMRVNARYLEGPQLGAYMNAQGITMQAPNTDGSSNLPNSTQFIAPNTPFVAPEGSDETIVRQSLPAAALVLRTQDGQSKTYPLDREIIHIGRNTANDIVLNDPKISRFHCEIRYENGEFVLYDLDSRNTTKVNNTKAQQKQLVKGDILTIGPFHLNFDRR